MIIGISGLHGSGKSLFSKMLIQQSIRIHKYDLLALIFDTLIDGFSYDYKKHYKSILNFKNFIKQTFIKPKNILQFKQLLLNIGININTIESNIEEDFKNLTSYNNNTKIIIRKYADKIENHEKILNLFFTAFKNDNDTIFYYIYTLDEFLIFKSKNIPVVYFDIEKHLAELLIKNYIKDFELQQYQLNKLNDSEYLKQMNEIKNNADFLIKNDFKVPDLILDKFITVFNRIKGNIK